MPARTRQSGHPAGVGARPELSVPQMRKKLASAGSVVVALLATAAVVLDIVDITFAEAMERSHEEADCRGPCGPRSSAWSRAVAGADARRRRLHRGDRRVIYGGNAIDGDRW